MRTELPRQLIHLSGLLFIILAQFIEKEITITYFFVLALFFLLYSEYVKREEKKLTNILNRLEHRFRDLTFKFERKEYLKNPFRGAFWFYLSCAITLFIFPFHIASAACCMLAVGDSLSTLFGVKFGRHKITKNKTFEGSLACFLGSLAVGGFFVNPFLTLVGATGATFAELSTKINDNLTIPIFSGLVIFLFSIII
ncbi:MAG: hypothetical protein GTN76_06480 [Candidatus Aenigmarchaeota archaeon]|nr:hypothetical protein [Candidatus Aenigmarchaeota archaeon]